MTNQKQYKLMHGELNERQWRLFLATEAAKIGYGGISQVAALSGSAWKTIKRGIHECFGRETLPEGRIRGPGGGKKKIIDTDQTLLQDLDKLIDDTKGNPMNFVKWMTKSIAHLVKGLQQLGHTIKNTALLNLFSGRLRGLSG